MSGVIQTLFGGSSSKSSSNNQAYPWAQQNFGGASSSGYNGGMGAMAGLLGLGGNPNSGATALNNFFNSAGGQFQLNQGVNDVNANMASRGLLNSGADMKGLEDYRQGLASTYLQNYIGDVGNYAKMGLGGASMITDAGQQSHSSGSESTGNMGKFLGNALSLAFI